MGKSKDRLIGELLFRTQDGGKAFVSVYRGRGIFTLKRMMQDGTIEEKINVDVYSGDLKDYVSDATLKWSDLERDTVEFKPKW
jgi:hypothetical protein